jgi:hypothetical protein
MVTQLPQADRPEVVLPAPADEAQQALAEAMGRPDRDARRESLQRVVGAWPAYLEAWARLADAARDDVERYAYARVGYHRGLDAIRKNGWGGNGFVRWRHGPNRGFLLCLEALRTAAAAIGEDGEPARLADFLIELDPDWSTPD